MMKKGFEDSRVVVATLFAICLASAAIPQGLQAQATILTACYVPDVGVVYRIKETGLPGACTETTHVEFSWNMEGPVGPQGATGAQGATGPEGPSGGSIPDDGSVTTAKLADNAVTSAKILDGTVGSLEIATGAVGSTEVADNSLTAADLATGAVTLETTNAIRANVSISAATTLSINDLSCPSGWFATGSGFDFEITGFGPEPRWLRNEPSGDGGWLFTIENENGADSLVLDIYIRCVRLVM